MLTKESSAEVGEDQEAPVLNVRERHQGQARFHGAIFRIEQEKSIIA